MAKLRDICGKGNCFEVMDFETYTSINEVKFLANKRDKNIPYNANRETSMHKACAAVKMLIFQDYAEKVEKYLHNREMHNFARCTKDWSGGCGIS